MWHGQSFCSIYYLLQSWHFSWYTLHVLYLVKLVCLLWVKIFPTVCQFWSIFSDQRFLIVWWRIYLVFQFTETWSIFVHVVDFVLAYFCVFVSFVRSIILKIFTSYLLLWIICFIVSCSFFLFISFMVYVVRRLTKYFIAAIFSGGCHESLGIIMSVFVDFL